MHTLESFVKIKLSLDFLKDEGWYLQKLFTNFFFSFLGNGLVFSKPFYKLLLFIPRKWGCILDALFSSQLTNGPNRPEAFLA
jgi:hypothetical protein